MPSPPSPLPGWLHRDGPLWRQGIRQTAMSLKQSLKLGSPQLPAHPWGKHCAWIALTQHIVPHSFLLQGCTTQHHSATVPVLFQMQAAFLLCCPPLQLYGKIPFCLKSSRCASQLEGSLWEKHAVGWMGHFLRCRAVHWFHFAADPHCPAP